MEITRVLPKECLTKILSFTTVKDVCRSSVVSSAFKDSADSDDTWGTFLPSDCHEMIAQSSSPNVISLPKRQLYFHLCDHPLLLPNHMTFSLDKESGKKVYMIGARGLGIMWASEPRYWNFISIPESRFPEIAVLNEVWWLEVKGSFNTKLLSPKTTYDVLFIFQFVNEMSGFTDSLINFSLNEGDMRTSLGSVVLDPPGIGVRQRKDGWMEIKVGEFHTENEEGDDGSVEFKIWQFDDYNMKKGLLVEGFELRPKRIVN